MEFCQLPERKNWRIVMMALIKLTMTKCAMLCPMSLHVSEARQIYLPAACVANKKKEHDCQNVTQYSCPWGRVWHASCPSPHLNHGKRGNHLRVSTNSMAHLENEQRRHSERGENTNKPVCRRHIEATDARHSSRPWLSDGCACVVIAESTHDRTMSICVTW